MPIYTNDPYDDGLFPVEPSLRSSIGIGPKVTKAIDAATSDWLDKHPEATTTVEDNSLTNAKFMDGSVNSRVIENESITTDDIADSAITTPKIASNAVTASKIASSAADGLRVMSTTQPGVAKVGAGLTVNNGSLELNGGSIAPAVTAWLDAHPEATTTVQDNSITLDKLERSLSENVSNLIVASSINGFYPIAMTDGCYVPTGAINTVIDVGSQTANPVWKSAVINVVAGDIFVISGAGSSNSTTRVWCLTDLNEKVLSVWAYDAQGCNKEIVTATEDGYLVVNTKNDDVSFYGYPQYLLTKEVIAARGSKETLGDRINLLTVKDLIDVEALSTENALIKSTGEYDSASSTWSAVKYDVSGKVTLRVSGWQPSTNGAYPFCVFLDENNQVVSYINLDLSTTKYYSDVYVAIPNTAMYIVVNGKHDQKVKYETESEETPTTINARLLKVENDMQMQKSGYAINTLSYRPLGVLSKGYICLTCDDGNAELATYTIPMLISKGVPCTFGLFSDSQVLTNQEHRATIIDAISNHGCSVAVHGHTNSWVDDVDSMVEEIQSQIDAMNDMGIYPSGGIMPGASSGHAYGTSAIRAVAGGILGCVTADSTSDEEIIYGIRENGPRTNQYSLQRVSVTSSRYTLAMQKRMIDEAIENNWIVIPFWHDTEIANNPSYQARLEELIDYAISSGIEFCTLAEIPTLI